MQVVDVLRDYPRCLAGPVEAGEREVPAPRLGCGELRVHSKAPTPGFVAHLLTGEEFVERDRAVFRPEPAGRSEVGNATLRGNSGAGERRDHARRLDEFL